MESKIKTTKEKIRYGRLPFLRFRKIQDEYLLTNDWGGYVFLPAAEFNAYLSGSLDKKSAFYGPLAENNFIKEEMDMDAAIRKYGTRKNFVFGGPALHIIVVTLRCNHRCVYCHASARNLEAKETDMTVETARSVVERIFDTTSPRVIIEFQGGEPTLNWPVIESVIAEARKLNKERGKQLEFRLISNFSLITEDKYRFLIDNSVELCTSLDGPKELHERNRPQIDGRGCHANVLKWIKRLNKDYPEIRKKGYIWKMGAIVVISRFSLPMYREIVDEYVKAGFSSMFLRPLNPFGFSREVWDKIKYTDLEFIDFYKKSLDHIIDINLKGTLFVEKLAKTFLAKILTDNDPNMMDIRSPCGAGLGQLAYNHNGDVYTCDEGRMMSMMGDESFKIGNVRENTYEEIVTHPITRTLCAASCLEGLAGCSDCAYLPYCGTCPIYNYFEQGNIFGQMPNNERCRINMAILDYLFEKMRDEKVRKVFENWLDK
ncbi:MAG: His-Xaa-Ser system radical SAM maturase HxsB [Candidatus Falkowbacteria bacterium]